MPAHRTEMKHFNINSFAPFPKVRARSSFFLFSLSFFFLFYDSGFHGQPKLSLRLWGSPFISPVRGIECHCNSCCQPLPFD
ncbi:hypothetical protein CBS63078_7220 [Aspergillus niger]|nr:hypothetical protein CBS11852_8876 [Aspergillus niger]KAI2896224.1 hypothetical protein CBS13152_3435 [Aspergillus niger]KAI2899824.1 hypothetical protein CBS63078_7220 [Aspergillus niger]KAI2963384.1 hypothetical protein CBS147323_6874 [Aspergillus niger]KAI3014103.1 hypothetical protein CBS147345_5452 [Aspergillus niger]